ncbi:MAG TPA: fumarylacetoacetate hydrolase family protein [Acidobacteriaceae bacterium]|jgi:2-keto-4-pentenoate hydratase/2-oxohepta-3-ene-1,7-dioic acid hydratase in catechol pathway|nr:fumarylacetoacetate hydrolase family protein [Acidobacteriaceae bacterium]
MKLISFAFFSDPTARPGLLVGDEILDLTPLGVPDTVSSIAVGPVALRQALEMPETSRIARSGVRLLTPIPRPPRIFCVGLNYRDHAIEAKMEIPKVPTIFLKLPSAVIGPEETVRIPAMTQQPDYEVELAIVIGKAGRDIPREKWREHVFGYTILNDVSARDVQLATSQWTLGKSFDTFCPIGPAIVSQDEIPDPHALDIRLSIGGEVLQHSNTRELIFKAPELIAYLSSITPLEPGDIISTGTPAGVGLGRTPKRWLQPGETMTAEVEGLGQLINPVEAEPGGAGN